MKTCHTCKELKPLTEFAICTRNKDGLTGNCKVCKRAYDNANYKKNLPRRKSYIVDYRKAKALELKRYVFEYLSDHPCLDCGESDPLVLEFDHIDRATKSNTVSTLTFRGGSLGKLKEEILKCEVRCANCHRRRTAQQFGWAKLEWQA